LDPSKAVTAQSIMESGLKAMQDRASSRDAAGKGERSMKACIDAFNALYGTSLSEEQGWMFMVLLKAARARQGDLTIDDYVDGAAYFSLAGECAAKASSGK